MRHLRLLLLLALVACPPVLDNEPIDDDDTVEDDDDTVEDDDDTGDDDTVDDDDDVSSACKTIGDGWVSVTSETLGFDFDGTWYEGDLSFDGDALTLTMEDGQQHVVRVSDPEPFWGAQGQGSLFWYSPLNTGWGTDALVAFDTGDVGGRGLLANETDIPEPLSELWGLDVIPDLNLCSNQRVEDDCGLYQALPVDAWTWIEGEPAEATVVDPGNVVELPDGYAFRLHRGAWYSEVWCTDFYEWQYSYAYWFWFE